MFYFWIRVSAGWCYCTQKIDFHFLRNWMAYDRSDRFFLSWIKWKSVWFIIKRKTFTTIIISIQFVRKWKFICLNVHKIRYKPCTLRKLYFHFLSQWMGYDRDDSFWTKWKFHLVQKLSPRSYPIHCERKWKYSFLSVGAHKSYLIHRI